MLAQLLPLLLVHSATVATDRIAVPAVASAEVESLRVRLSSPDGTLWQGTLRVGNNQSASYSQNLSQASTETCPPGSPHDRSERSAINFNVYVQSDGQGGRSYRVDASWSRPIRQPSCGESGTRTVQINQGLAIEPGQTSTIEGDAGLRVEVTRLR